MTECDITTIAEETKTCSCCQCVKAFSEYYKDKQKKDGLYSRCKSCHQASTKKYAQSNKEIYSKASKKYRIENLDKVLESQRISQRKLYELNPEKYRERSIANYHSDPEKMREISKLYREVNPDYCKNYFALYYQENKQKIKIAVREREKELGDKLKPINAEKARRYAARKLHATPSWADIDAIKEIYRDAAKITEATGIQHHVDHLVPLQSRLVCGLHVACNLQIITASDNQSKSNKWCPDC